VAELGVLKYLPSFPYCPGAPLWRDPNSRLEAKLKWTLDSVALKYFSP